MVLRSQLLSKNFFIPNLDNFGVSSSEVAVAAPPWLTSESEDHEPLTHKLEVHAGIMAMQQLQRSKRVYIVCTYVRNY